MTGLVKESVFKFPDVWQDDTRMNALFAPFRSKALDPVAWESKFKFWDSLIHQYSLQTKTPSVSLGSLKNAFTRNGKCPTCLESVMEEMKRTKTLAAASDYNHISMTADSYITWIVKSVVHSPLEWTLNKIKSPFNAKPDPETVSYIHLPVAKHISEEFYNQITPEQRGKLIAIKELAGTCAVKEEDVITLIKPVMEKGKAAVTLISPDIVVKFAKDRELKVIITKVDRGVYELERNEKVLSANIESLELEKETAMNKVRTCLKTDRKQMAKSWLRRKKELEKHIEKRANALDNIRSLLDKLRQVDCDNLILDSYQLGIAALKKSFAENGLTEERAEGTMDLLEDVLDVTRDIEDTLARPLDAGGDLDLEAELAALLAEDEGNEMPPGDTSGPGNVSLDFGLPDVPNTSDLESNLEERLNALSFS